MSFTVKEDSSASGLVLDNRAQVTKGTGSPVSPTEKEQGWGLERPHFCLEPAAPVVQFGCHVW